MPDRSRPTAATGGKVLGVVVPNESPATGFEGQHRLTAWPRTKRPRHPFETMHPHRTERRNGLRGPDASMVQRLRDQNEIVFKAGAPMAPLTTSNPSPW